MKEELLRLRRDIHANPELSFQERRTATIAEQKLREHGFELRRKIADVGFFADRGWNPHIAIRSEMDALPLPELNMVAYRSVVANVSHACGHDAHVACVLGAAQETKQPLRIIMQPGEEQPDGEGISGAQHVVNSGALDGIDVLLGLHVDPTLPTGSLALITIPLQSDFRFSARLDAGDVDFHLDGALRGARRSDYGQIRAAIEKAFPEQKQAITWTEVPGEVKQIDVEPLLQALSAVSSNATLSKRKTWSTSFNVFARQVPCVLLLLGCELRGDRRSQHTGNFDIDEECLPVGAAALAALVEVL